MSYTSCRAIYKTAALPLNVQPMLAEQNKCRSSYNLNFKRKVTFIRVRKSFTQG